MPYVTSFGVGHAFFHGNDREVPPSWTELRFRASGLKQDRPRLPTAGPFPLLWMSNRVATQSRSAAHFTPAARVEQMRWSALGVRWKAPFKQRFPMVDWRRPSLIRGCMLAFAGIPLAISFSGFPAIAAHWYMCFPVFLNLVGTADTARCLQPRWSFYHGGVMLMLYADLMTLFLLLFCWLYPFGIELLR